MLYARFIKTPAGALRPDGIFSDFYAAAQPKNRPPAYLVIDQAGDPSRSLRDGWGAEPGDRERVRDLYRRTFSDEERDLDETYDPYGD